MHSLEGEGEGVGASPPVGSSIQEPTPLDHADAEADDDAATAEPPAPQLDLPASTAPSAPPADSVAVTVGDAADEPELDALTSARERYFKGKAATALPADTDLLGSTRGGFGDANANLSVRSNKRSSLRVAGETSPIPKTAQILAPEDEEGPSSFRSGDESAFDEPSRKSGMFSARGSLAECSPLLPGEALPMGEPPSGRGGAMANLLNCILDAGLVGVPYALGQSGLLLGILMVIGTGLLTCYGLELLIHVSDAAVRHGAISCVAYEEVAELAGGKRMRALLVGVQFLYCFGALVGYVFVVKDSLSDALKALAGGTKLDIAGDSADEMLYAGMVAVVVIFPLCCLRSVADLGHASAVTVAIVIGLLGIFTGNYISEGFQGDEDEKYSFVARPKFFNVVGTCIFAFMCHHNEFSIYRSLGSKATPENFTPVLRGAVALSVLLSLAIGVMVYLSYGDSLKSDIFKNYTSTHPAIQIAKLGMVVNMLLSFPMNFGVAREMLQVLLSQATATDDQRKRHSMARTSISAFSGRERLSRSRNTMTRQSHATGMSGMSCMSFDPEGNPTTMVWSELDRPPKSFAESAAGGGVRDHTPFGFHVLTTVPLFIVALAAGLLITSLGATLDLVGGLLGSLLGFVFPAIIALQLEDRPYGGRIACYVLLTVGVIAGFAGTISAILTFINGED